jgi:hypothetical protein
MDFDGDIWKLRGMTEQLTIFMRNALDGAVCKQHPLTSPVCWRASPAPT